MCVTKEALINQRSPERHMGEVETAEGRAMKVKTAGDLRIAVSAAGKDSLTLGKALVPEGLQENLLSVGAFCDQNRDNEVRFCATKCVFLDEDKQEVLVARRARGSATYRTTFKVPTKNMFSLPCRVPQGRRSASNRSSRERREQRKLLASKANQ
jgi:hypothetical protein